MNQNGLYHRADDGLPCPALPFALDEIIRSVFALLRTSLSPLRSPYAWRNMPSEFHHERVSPFEGSNAACLHCQLWLAGLHEEVLGGLLTKVRVLKELSLCLPYAALLHVVLVDKILGMVDHHVLHALAFVCLAQPKQNWRFSAQATRSTSATRMAETQSRPCTYLASLHV